MAISFNQTKGSAQKDKIETYNFGNREDHKVRLVGDLLPRYVYWVKGENNKILAFDTGYIKSRTTILVYFLFSFIL